MVDRIRFSDAVVDLPIPWIPITIAFPSRIEFDSEDLMASYLVFLNTYGCQLTLFDRNNFSRLEMLVVKFLFNLGYTDMRNRYERSRPVIVTDDEPKLSSVKAIDLDFDSLFVGQHTDTLDRLIIHLAEQLQLTVDQINASLFGTSYTVHVSAMIPPPGISPQKYLEENEKYYLSIRNDLPPLDLFLDNTIHNGVERFIEYVQQYSDEEILKCIWVPKWTTRIDLFMNLYETVGVDTFRWVSSVNPDYLINRFTTLLETPEELSPPYLVYGKFRRYRLYSLDELNNSFLDGALVPERPGIHFSTDDVQRLLRLIDDRPLRSKIIRWLSILAGQPPDVIPTLELQRSLVSAWYAARYRSEIYRQDIQFELIGGYPVALFDPDTMSYLRLDDDTRLADLVSQPIDDSKVAEWIMDSCEYYLLVLFPKTIFSFWNK